MIETVLIIIIVFSECFRKIFWIKPRFSPPFVVNSKVATCIETFRCWATIMVYGGWVWNRRFISRMRLLYVMNFAAYKTIKSSHVWMELFRIFLNCTEMAPIPGLHVRHKKLIADPVGRFPVKKVFVFSIVCIQLF